MDRVMVDELAEHVGERVQVAGWLHRQRRLSQVTFLIIRDRSGLGQVVITDPRQVGAVSTLTAETVLSLTGEVVASSQAPGGG